MDPLPLEARLLVNAFAMLGDFAGAPPVPDPCEGPGPTRVAHGEAIGCGCPYPGLAPCSGYCGFFLGEA